MRHFYSIYNIEALNFEFNLPSHAFSEDALWNVDML